MAWKIALCDDEQMICEQLKSYLERFSQERREEFQLAEFHSAEMLLAEKQDFDILLLDIQMGGMTGMNAARELRKRGSKAVIFFITSMTHYAIEGYEVHAFSFLAKPLLYEVFAERMGDAVRGLKKSAGQSLQFSTAEGLIRVNTNEVSYIESFRHEIRFVCEGFSFTEGEVSLSGLEQKLTGCGFFRVHKSYLVNMRNIRLIRETEIDMMDGTTVPLSKYRRREFLSTYAVYRKEWL